MVAETIANLFSLHYNGTLNIDVLNYFRFFLVFDTMIRVLLADDHPIVRAGTRTMLVRYEDIEIVGEAGDADETLKMAAATNPDVLLLDAVLPGRRAKILVRDLLTQQPHLRILMLSAYKDVELVMGLLRAGVSGYLLKESSIDAIAQAVRDVQQGKKAFSPEIVELLQQAALGEIASPTKNPLDKLSKREKEVLDLMVEGLSNHAISQRLFISERTVKYHIGNIYGKLAVENRTEAVILALKWRDAR